MVGPIAPVTAAIGSTNFEAVAGRVFRPDEAGAGNGVGKAYTPPTESPAEASFGDALARGLQAVSGLEHQADAVTQNMATGGGATIEDLMLATTKAQLGVDMLATVRDRAVEAYQEIMRMPV